MNNNTSSLQSQLGEEKMATLKELWAATKRVRDRNQNNVQPNQNVTGHSINNDLCNKEDSLMTNSMQSIILDPTEHTTKSG